MSFFRQFMRFSWRFWVKVGVALYIFIKNIINVCAMKNMNASVNEVLISCMKFIQFVIPGMPYCIKT
jgi:putative Ca2+/H+ antiporter (TMEM165/GDT1 family)